MIAKQKVMFSKNYKAASTSIASIILQIATHYHQFEIVQPEEIKNSPPKSKNHGYLLQHAKLSNLTNFLTFFPKSEFLWVSSFRNPRDSAISWIQYHGWAKNYTTIFKQTLEKFERGDFKGYHNHAFLNSMSEIIFDSCKKLSGTEFERCANEVLEKFDLLIPVENFDQGLIMMQKQTCLPISDFAYLKLKYHAEKLRIKEEHMQEILKYREQDIWFYEKAKSKFDREFYRFHEEFCTSFNCEAEIAELHEENKKLERKCGLQYENEEAAAKKFSFDFSKIETDYKLALRCLSFAVQSRDKKLIRQYNEVLTETKSTNKGRKFYKKLGQLWLQTLQEKENFFK